MIYLDHKPKKQRTFLALCQTDHYLFAKYFFKKRCLREDIFNVAACINCLVMADSGMGFVFLILLVCDQHYLGPLTFLITKLSYKCKFFFTYLDNQIVIN